MELNTRGRTELKSYFVKNAIPTESNFSDFIDAVLSQKDDGIVKPPGNPLSIEASGDDSTQKKVLNLYRSFADDKPSWVVTLNPRSDPAKPATARPGFNISDGEGNNRLFLDRSNGNVGIRTISPAETLHVNGRIRSGALTIGDWPADARYVLIGTSTLNQADNRNYALLQDSGHNAVGRTHLNSPLDIRFRIANVDKMTLAGNGYLGIGTAAPAKQLHIQQASISAPILSESRRPGLAITGQYPELTLFSRINNINHGPTIRLGSYDADTGTTIKQWVMGTSGRNSHFLDFGFSTNNNGNPHNGIRNFNGKTVLTLLNNGNVGIGTRNPNHALEVVGQICTSEGLFLNGSRATHLEADGSFYRFGGQVYITVDDNLYIRDMNSSIKFHFDTNAGIIRQDGWRSLPRASNWVNYGGGYNSAGYFKDKMGIVHLRGLIKNGTGNHMGTLPANCRPLRRELHVVSTNPNAAGRVDILADGRVWGIAYNKGWTSLDGISFRAR